MESTTYQTKITEALENVRQLSFEEKKDPTFSEARINILLDKILELKQKLVTQTNKINTVVEKIEKLTWFNDVDDASLMTINDLISSVRDLHSSLLRQYISVNYLRNKGIAKDETRELKSSMDDLKDVAADLESRFFFLPRFADFQETTKELSLV